MSDCSHFSHQIKRQIKGSDQKTTRFLPNPQWITQSSKHKDNWSYLELTLAIPVTDISVLAEFNPLVLHIIENKSGPGTDPCNQIRNFIVIITGTMKLRMFPDHCM